MITGRQMREARKLIGWSYVTLAKRSRRSLTLVSRLEAGDDNPDLEGTRLAVQRTLEAAGCIFIDENGEGPGVRLRKFSAAILAKPIDGDT